MITGGYEDFAACYPIAAITRRVSLCADQTQVGATLRLCQAHGSTPCTLDQFSQVGFLLGLTTMLNQGFNCTKAKTWIHGPGPVCRAYHFSTYQAY